MGSVVLINDKCKSAQHIISVIMIILTHIVALQPVCRSMCSVHFYVQKVPLKVGQQPASVFQLLLFNFLLPISMTYWSTAT